jgi:16S rRNA (cytosine1402-N4)-methyltransferase
MTENSHIPVLLSESVQGLALAPGQTVLDVTLGLGGHSQKFLEAVGETGTLIGIDADEENLRHAQNRLENIPGTKIYHHTNFLSLPELNLPKCDRIFADLGVSSPHIDDPERGFTFRTDAPLDLRYDREHGQTAAEWIQSSEAEEIIKALRYYGELVQARKIGEAIASAKPKTTYELRDAVESIVGYRIKQVLPQVFQAFRIIINSEQDALQALLDTAPTVLAPGGILAVISYHSLEDRMVKRTFRTLSTPEKDDYTGAISKEAPFSLLTKKPIRPSEMEVSENPRSRSALLRIIQKAQQ